MLTFFLEFTEFLILPVFFFLPISAVESFVSLPCVTGEWSVLLSRTLLVKDGEAEKYATTIT